jgi:Imm-5 like putative immunity protein
MAISDDERREVARWAAASAERGLPLFEALAPNDPRPSEAIRVARAFSDGRAGRSRALSRIALAAHRAGREIGDPVGLAVARAASLAAAAANIHGEATIGTLGHILGAASYVALARELAGGGPRAADEEVRWATEQASPTLRDLVGRVPSGPPGRGRLAEIQRELDIALREPIRRKPG